MTSSRDGDRLVVVYHAGPNREVRYTYSRASDAPRLLVDVQFVDHGAGDKARQVYDSGLAAPRPRPRRRPLTRRLPRARATRAEPFDQRPGAELKGLTSVGVLVEDLSAQAAACGLNRQTIETALAKKLADAGFTVRRNSDEDTYPLCEHHGVSAANGLACPATMRSYTHATARLPYHEQPVLVQVSLMHRGGMGTSAPAAHGAAVTPGLEGYVISSSRRSHDANK